MVLNVVNLTPDSWRLTIGDDGLDLTRAVLSLEIEHPLAEIKTPLTWSGQLTLSDRLHPSEALAESMDDEVNPGRWQMGAHPIRLYINGLHLLTCRIGDDYTYNEVTREAQASLTDKLGLINRDHPREILGDEFESRGTSVQYGSTQEFRFGILPWPEFAKHILRQSQTTLSSPILSPDDLLTGGLSTSVSGGGLPGQPRIDGYSATQYDTNANPAVAIQEVFALRQRWVWCNRDEKIQSTRYPVNGRSGALAGIPLQDLIQYERFPAPDPVKAESVSASGSGIERDTNDAQEVWPQIIEKLGADTDGDGNAVPGSEVILERKRIDRPRISGGRGGWSRTQRERIWQAKGVAFPEQQAGNNSLFLREDRTKRTRYDGEGFPRSSTTTIRQARGTISPDLFEDDVSLVTTTESERWVYTDQMQPLDYRRTRLVPSFALSGETTSSALRISETESIDWERIGTGVVRQVRRVWKARGEGEGEEPFQLVLDENSSTNELLSAPPAPPMLDATKAVRVRRFSVRVRSNNDNNSLPPEVYDFNYINNRQSLENAAELVLALKKQRERRRRVTHAWLNVLANYEPFQRIDLHNRAFIIDGLGLSIAVQDNGVQLAVSYSANSLGAIAEISKPKIPLAAAPGIPVTPPPEPTYTPPPPAPHYTVELDPPDEEPVERDPAYSYYHAPASEFSLSSGADEFGDASWAFPVVLGVNWENLTFDDWLAMAG